MGACCVTKPSKECQKVENKLALGIMGRMKMWKGNAEQYVGSAGKGTWFIKRIHWRIVCVYNWYTNGVIGNPLVTVQGQTFVVPMFPLQYIWKWVWRAYYCSTVCGCVCVLYSVVFTCSFIVETNNFPCLEISQVSRVSHMYNPPNHLRLVCVEGQWLSLMKTMSQKPFP